MFPEASSTTVQASLQSNALVVEHNHKHKEILSSSKQSEVTRKRVKIDTGLLHNRLHRPDGVFATIRAHHVHSEYVESGTKQQMRA